MKNNRVVSWNGLVRRVYCSEVWYEDRVTADSCKCRVDDLDLASKEHYGKTWRVWSLPQPPTADELAANPWPEEAPRG